MWFYLSLLSALFSGLSIVLNKRTLNKVSPSLVTWSLFVFSLPLLVYPAFKDGMPEVNTTFIIAMTVSIIVFTLAKTLSLKALQASATVSEILPLTYLTVLFNYILALITLNGALTPLHLGGLCIIVIGGYILKVTEAKEGFWRPFTSLFKSRAAQLYLLAMALYPFSSVLDKISMQNLTPVNPYFVLLVGNTVSTLMVTGYMVRRNPQWVNNLRKNFIGLMVNGIIYTLVSIFYLMSIIEGQVALVSGVKKLEVLIALGLGWILFTDKPKREVIFGSGVMLLGVIIIKLASG